LAKKDQTDARYKRIQKIRSINFIQTSSFIHSCKKLIHPGHGPNSVVKDGGQLGVKPM